MCRGTTSQGSCADGLTPGPAKPIAFCEMRMRILRKISAWGIAGLSVVCKTIRDGFDSRPRLHLTWWVRFHPEWKPEWVLRDGRRLGPFMFSTQWTQLDDFERQVFPDGPEAFRAAIKSDGYTPPDNPVHLARDVMQWQAAQIKRWKGEAIAARKELSKLKRKGRA